MLHEEVSHFFVLSSMHAVQFSVTRPVTATQHKSTTKEQRRDRQNQQVTCRTRRFAEMNVRFADMKADLTV